MHAPGQLLIGQGTVCLQLFQNASIEIVKHGDIRQI
jgi:hypothetical protein